MDRPGGEKKSGNSSDEDKDKASKEISLVLTVRKGANFVCKKQSGEHCKLVAKLGNSTIESDIVQIRSPDTEPCFNSLMTWSFTRKEFQSLRSTKTPLRLEIHLVDNKGQQTSLLGYCILCPRSAVTVENQNEMYGMKSDPVPLVGTKDPWIKYHPELFLTLHVEDSKKMIQGSTKEKSKGPVHPATDNRSTQKDFQSSTHGGTHDYLLHNSSIRSLQSFPNAEGEREQKFAWRTNDEMGYFELGPMSENDDLYVLYTTIVGCDYLHLLGPEEVYKREDYLWSVQYEAFNSHISSDPFLLSNEGDSRKTFIGDKATARIRTNGALFYDFLRVTALKFRVLRTPAQGVNKTPVEMGVSFMELKELARPEISSLKYKLDVVSVQDRGSGDQSEDPHRRPEVRIFMELHVVPNFFVAGRNFANSEDVISVIEESVSHEKQQKSTLNKPASPQPRLNDSKLNATGDGVQPLSLDDTPATIRDTDLSENSDTDTEDQIAQMSLRSPVEPLNQSNPGSGSKKKVQYKDSVSAQKSSAGGDQHKESPKNYKSPVLNTPPAPPKELVHKELLQSEDMDTSDIEELPELDIIPPGTYEVRIELEQLWITSQTPLTTDFTISFAYPPLGIPEDAPVSCRAKKDPSITVSGDLRKRCAVIYDGTWKLVVVLGQLTDALLREPIQVEIRHFPEDLRQPHFAVAKIPFGKLFFADLVRTKRSLAGSADVYRLKDNLVIGVLKFTLKLQYLGTLSNTVVPHSELGAKDTVDGQAQSRKSSAKKKSADEDLVKTMGELETWKSQEEAVFREKLKDKEHAYLRILSEEWNKRDEERERQVKEKAQVLDAQNEKVNLEIRRMEERELELRRLQHEAVDTIQKANYENVNLVEDHKARVRRLKEQHNIEVEALLLRIQQAEDNSDRMKGKIMSLEGKLNAKEEELDRLRASRSEWPDAKMERELRSLKDKVDRLSLQLTEAKKERDSYKREFQNLSKKQDLLQRERDAQLLNDNENLRAQIVASQYKSDLRNERKTIKEVADDIQSLRLQYDKREGRDRYAKNNRYPPSPTRKSREVTLGTYSELDLRHGLRKEYYRNGKDTKVSPPSRSPRIVKELDSEMRRLVEERNKLLNTGAYSECDVIIRDIENQLTRLASELDVARDRYRHSAN